MIFSKWRSLGDFFNCMVTKAVAAAAVVAIRNCDYSVVVGIDRDTLFTMVISEWRSSIRMLSGFVIHYYNQ